MIAAMLSLLLAQPIPPAPASLQIQPASCPDLTPERMREQNGGELRPGSGFQTCPPEGPGRHIFFFNGFEGQKISFFLSEVNAGGYSDREMDLTLSVTGPMGFKARGRTIGASLLLNLPHTGRYELVIENNAPPGVSRSPYMISATEHAAMSPRSYDDCSRLSLPRGDVGIEIATYFLRPGGSAVVRPTWTMNGITYDAYVGCFTDWKVAEGDARLVKNRIGNWTLVVSPNAVEGSKIRVTATAGGQQALNSATVDSTETK